MFIIKNLIVAIATILDIICNIFIWSIFLRSMLSWFNLGPSNRIIKLLYDITEPVLSRVRRFLPHMAVDISPIIVFFIIIFLQKFLIITLFDIVSVIR